MIRIKRDRATGQVAATDPERQRAAIAEELAAAVEAIPTEDCNCPHNRISCGKCGERRAIQAAAFVIRLKGGVQR